MANEHPSLPAFAYLVPLNPYAPVAGECSTLVRHDRIHVGDRLHVSWTETRGDEQIVQGSPDEWEVVAIESAGDEWREQATIRRKNGPHAIWDGRLVLRQVRR